MARMGISSVGQIAITVRILDAATAKLATISKSFVGLGRSAATASGAASSGLLGMTVRIAGLLMAAQAMKSITTMGASFNSTIELAKVGIASVLASNMDFVNGLGQTAEGAEAVAAATGEAARQVKLLQIAGLQTVATTDRLVVAFQQAIAAGTASGMSLDQIRELTIGVVQAATALNMPVEQFNEEIRSLFEGTINIHSRVSRALLITNEQINRWKSQGPDVFFTKVHERLAAFIASGEVLAKTWVVAWSNVKESFQVTFGAMLQPAMDRLKKFAVEIQQQILFLDKNLAQVGIRPEVKTTFTVMGSILYDMAGAATTFGQEILNAVGQLGTWLERNKGVVNETWDAFKSIGMEIVYIAAEVGGIVVDFMKWVIESGTMREIFLAVADALDQIKQILADSKVRIADILKDLTLIGLEIIRGTADLLRFIDAIGIIRFIMRDIHNTVTLIWFLFQAIGGTIEEMLLEPYRILGMIIQGIGLALDVMGNSQGPKLIAIGEEMRKSWSRSFNDARNFWRENVIGADKASGATGRSASNMKTMTDLTREQSMQVEKQIKTFGELQEIQRDSTLEQRLALGELAALPLAQNLSDALRIQRDYSRQQRDAALAWQMMPRPRGLTDAQQKAMESFMRWQTERAEEYNANYLKMTGSTAGEEMRLRAQFEKQLEQEKEKLVKAAIFTRKELELASAKDMTPTEARENALTRLRDLEASFNTYVGEKKRQEILKDAVEEAELQQRGDKTIFERKRALLEREFRNNETLLQAHLTSLAAEEISAYSETLDLKRTMAERSSALFLSLYGTDAQIARQQNETEYKNAEKELEESFEKRRRAAGDNRIEMLRIYEEEQEETVALRARYDKKGRDAERLINLNQAREIAETHGSIAEIAAAQRLLNAEQIARKGAEYVTALDASVNAQTVQQYRDMIDRKEDMLSSLELVKAESEGRSLDAAQINLETELRNRKREMELQFRDEAIKRGWSDEQVVAQHELLNARLAALDEAYAKKLQNQLDQIRLTQISNAASTMLQYQQAFGSRQEQITAEVNSLRAAHKVEMNDLNKSLEERLAIEAVYAEKVNRLYEEMNGNFSAGYKRGLAEYVRTAQTSFQMGASQAQVTADLMTSAMDTFLNSSREGFKNWKDAVISILNEVLDAIQKVFIQALVTQAMSGLLGFLNPNTPSTSVTGNMARAYASGMEVNMAKGGILPGGFQAFAQGGIARRKTLGMVGEGRYAEAIVPLPDGRSIPAVVTGNVGGGGDVIINLNNQSGVPLTMKETGRRQDNQGRQVRDVVMTLLTTDPNFRAAIGSAR